MKTDYLKQLATIIMVMAVSQIALCASQYETYIDSAEYYAGKEQFSKAAHYYRMALRDNPASPLNPMVFANLGMCLTETGEYGEALQAYEVALVRDPNSVNTLTNQAKTLLLCSRSSEALESLEKAIGIDSLAIPPRRLHGQLMLMKGRPTDALKDFTILIDRNSDDISALDGAARSHELMGNHRDAANLFRRRLEIEADPDVYTGLVSSLINDSRLEEADNCVYEAIEKFPRTGELYLLRGVIHQMHYRTKEALTDKKTAISLGVPIETADRILPLHSREK